MAEQPADVPLGSLLSGGLDSSAISAFAVAALDGDARRLPTFSRGLPGEGRGFVPTPRQSSWDEPLCAAGGELGTPHRTVLVAPEEVLEQDEAVLQARDLPGWGELDASLYLLFRQVREHTTVALSGESADEVFGGYPFFHDPSALAHDGFPGWPARAGPGNRCGGRSPNGWRRRNTSARYREALAEAPRLDGEDAAQRRLREVAYLALSRWLPAMLERGPDEHGGRPGSARAVLRPPPGGVRMEPALGAEERRRGKQPAAPPRAPAAGDPERRKSGFPANPDPRYLALARAGRPPARRRPLAAVRTGGRRAGPPGFEQGTPLPSPRASASPTAGLAYLLNLTAG